MYRTAQLSQVGIVAKCQLICRKKKILPGWLSALGCARLLKASQELRASGVVCKSKLVRTQKASSNKMGTLFFCIA